MDTFAFGQVWSLLKNILFTFYNTELRRGNLRNFFGEWTEIKCKGAQTSCIGRQLFWERGCREALTELCGHRRGIPLLPFRIHTPALGLSIRAHRGGWLAS